MGMTGDAGHRRSESSWSSRPEDPNDEPPVRLPIDALLLTTLFGPRPTNRGMIVARVALALCFLLIVPVLVLVLSVTADAIVDPTPLP